MRFEIRWWPSDGVWASSMTHHVWADAEFVADHWPELAADIQARYAGKYDTLVGCGLAGIPWVVALGVGLRVPYVLVRKPGDAKPRATFTPIVGRFGPERRCLFVDDLVGSGGTRRHVAFTLAMAQAELVGTVTVDSALSDAYGAGWDHKRRRAEAVR